MSVSQGIEVELAGNDGMGQTRRAISGLRCDLAGVLDLLIRRVGVPREEVFAFLPVTRLRELDRLEAEIKAQVRRKLSG